MLQRLRALRGEGSPLPDGAIPLGIGLVINGVTTYGFLAVAGHSLDKAEADSLAALWSLGFILAPGFFQPLEQEVARATAFRAARGLGSAPVLRKATQLGAALFGVVVLATVIAWPMKLRTEVFDHHATLLFALILLLLGFWLTEPVRGVLGGSGEFRRYSIYFAVEGASRLALALVLAAVGASVGPFGLAFAVVPLLAGFCAVWGMRPIATQGPNAPWSEISQSLGYLLAASLFTNLLLNIGPLAVKALSEDGDEGKAAAFLNGLIIARIPLFFFQAVQASLLPQLAALVGAGEIVEFRRVLRRLVMAVGALAVVGVVFAFIAGPFIVDLVFGKDIGRRDMALLAGASGLFMLAMSYAQAHIALHRQRRVTAGWLAGALSFPIVVMLFDDLFLRVELGLVAGGAVATAVMMALLPHHLESKVSHAPAPTIA